MKFHKFYTLCAGKRRGNHDDRLFILKIMYSTEKRLFFKHINCVGKKKWEGGEILQGDGIYLINYLLLQENINRANNITHFKDLKFVCWRAKGGSGNLEG